MADLLEKGSDSQRTVILFELQQLLDHCLEDTLHVLIPVLCRNVHTWSYELQISSTESLLDVLQQDTEHVTCKGICQAAFRVIRQSHSEDLFEAWGEILVVGLPNVDWEDADDLRNIVDTLDEFAKDDDDVSRKLAARVYGSFASCLSEEQVENQILTRALELANDEDLEVRGMVAESLAFIGAAVSIGVTEKLVWPKVLSLLRDPDARIHAATLRALAHILEAHRVKNHNSVLYSELLAPVFERECDFVRKAATADQRTVNDDTYLLLEIISEVFGQLVFAISPFFADEAARKDAYKAYLAMATCNGPIVRRYCAFNIPGVSKSIASGFATEMSSIVEFLSRDTDSETRWNLAAGIHESVALLASKTSIDNLFKSVVALLQDENPLVRMNTLEHFFPLLQCLTKDPSFEYMGKLGPVFENLTLLSEGNWRTQELLAKQLGLACVLVPPSTLKEKLLPLLYQMSEESTYLVRKAAMPSIARALWCIPSPQERDDAVQNFRMDWAEGGVFWMRMAFVDCANAAATHFSGQLFRRTFSGSVLRMADDPVPNVRLRLASELHNFAHACDGLPELEHAIECLNMDNDKDVREAMMKYRTKAKAKKNETAQVEDSKKLQAEVELFNQFIVRKASDDSKKVKPNTKSKFRGSSLLNTGKLAIGRAGTLDSNSPTAVADGVHTPRSKSRKSVPNSPNSSLMASPISSKSLSREESTHSNSSMEISSPKHGKKDKHHSSDGGSSEPSSPKHGKKEKRQSTDGDDGPSSLKLRKKLLGLTKKSKK